MNVGLRTYDRKGNIVTDLTGRYPKWEGSIEVSGSSDIKKNFDYVIPKNTLRISTIVYKGDPSQVRLVQETEEKKESVVDAWDIQLSYTSTGIYYEAVAEAGEARIPATIHYGYF